MKRTCYSELLKMALFIRSFANLRLLKMIADMEHFDERGKWEEGWRS